ncbi:MAG: alpha/beta hydrolase, partial [Roseiarcus sp.]
MRTVRFLAPAALAIAFASPGAAETLVPHSVYTAPQQLVAIDGARRLNLHCVGSGEPVVVLEAGSGNSMVTWRFVQAEIGAFTRVCAYDRAGLGFSDAAQRPSNVANMADDLSRLVAAAGVAKPFVLVGHSLGGATAVLYAATHPDDLAGVVLVEPAFAGDLHALQAELPVGK